MVHHESFKKIVNTLFSPEMLSLLILLVLILFIGTVFYSIYFSAMTITTAGFGDLHPTSDLSKLFTVFYIFMGLGVVLAFVQTLVQQPKRDSLLVKMIRRENSKG